MARSTRSDVESRGVRRASRAPATRTARLAAEGTRVLSQAQLRSIRDHARQLQEEYEIPGLAYALIQNGQVAAVECSGVLKLGESAPVNADSVFEIGSITKGFTATQLAMLVDEQKLGWDGCVRKTLRSFAMMDPWVTQEFRVSDILSHRSGLPAYCLTQMFLFGYSRDEIIRALRHVEPVTSFRSAYAYQNAVPLVAGKLIEKLSSKRWEEDLALRIFKPLGMSRSSADPKVVSQWDNVATGHTTDAAGKVIPLPPDWPFAHFPDVAGPSGAIRSSLNDMIRWALFQLGSGMSDGPPPLSEEGVKFTHAPRTLASFTLPAAAESSATGWFYRSKAPAPEILHDGGTLGMGGLLTLTPDQGAGLVGLINFSSALDEWRKDDRPRRPDSGAAALNSLYSKFQTLLLDRPLAEEEPPQHRAVLPPLPHPREPGRGAAPELDGLCGIYTNPAYGRFHIKRKAEELVMIIGPKKIVCPMKHLGGPLFRVDIPDLWGAWAPVTFFSGAGGHIIGFECPAFQDVNGGRFLRQNRS